jgi:hypothetical protein
MPRVLMRKDLATTKGSSRQPGNVLFVLETIDSLLFGAEKGLPSTTAWSTCAVIIMAATNVVMS